jgi:hypothetical protein
MAFSFSFMLSLPNQPEVSKKRCDNGGYHCYYGKEGEAKAWTGPRE